MRLLRKNSAQILQILFFALIFLFFLFPFDGNPDFYHHINAGRFVLQEKVLPHTDVFTFTRMGSPWIAYAWGSGVLLYLIYSTLGGLGISIWVAGMALTTFILLYFLLKSYHMSKKVIFSALLFAIAPIASRWPSRPELITYPFLIAILLINRLKTKYRKLPLLFPLLILFWANLYGSSVAIGLGILGMLALKQLLSDKFKLHKSSYLFYFSVLCSFPLSLLNGYGLKSVFYIFLIPQVARYEGEWAGIGDILTKSPLEYQLTTQYLILVYLLYLSIFLITVIFSFKKIRHYPFLAILSLAVFVPFLAFRHVPLAVLLSLPLFAALISSLSNMKKSILSWLSLIAGMLSLIVILWISPPRFPASTPSSVDLLAGFIKAHELKGRVFNHETIGSFLTFKFYPQMLVFYDTRDDLFIGSQSFTDLYGTFERNASVLPLLRKYKVDLVVGDLNDGLNYKQLFYSSSWAVVFLNDRYFVALPRQIAEDKNIPALQGVDPYSPTASKPGSEFLAEEYYKIALAANPSSSLNQARLAQTLLIQGKIDKAKELVDKMDDGTGPGSSLTKEAKYILLAQAYLNKGDCTKTQQYLEQAEKQITSKLIFHTGRKLPSHQIQVLAPYLLRCEQDAEKVKALLE